MYLLFYRRKRPKVQLKEQSTKEYEPKECPLKRKRIGVKQKGKFSRSVQTQQSKEELLMDLSLTVKEKLKVSIHL